MHGMRILLLVVPKAQDLVSLSKSGFVLQHRSKAVATQPAVLPCFSSIFPAVLRLLDNGWGMSSLFVIYYGCVYVRAYVVA